MSTDAHGSHGKHIYSHSVHWTLMMDVLPLSESNWTTVSQNNYKAPNVWRKKKKRVDINIALEIAATLQAQAN